MIPVVRLEANRDRHEHCRHVERLIHELRHVFSLGLGVQRNIREQDRMSLAITMAVVRLDAKRRQYGLDCDVHGRHVERLGQDPRHALSEALVSWSFHDCPSQSPSCVS